MSVDGEMERQVVDAEVRGFSVLTDERILSIIRGLGEGHFIVIAPDSDVETFNFSSIPNVTHRYATETPSGRLTFGRLHQDVKSR